MNTIVYVSIALLVLVLIVSVTTGSFGNLAGQFKDVTPDELETVRTKCTTMCNTARTAVVSTGTTAFGNSQYCSRTFNIDVNGDGILTDDENLPCWGDPIKVNCQASGTTATGVSITVNPLEDC
jgi:hypothetical protein